MDFRKPKLNVRDAQLYRGVTNIGFIKYIPDENIMCEFIYLFSISFNHSVPKLYI